MLPFPSPQTKKNEIKYNLYKKQNPILAALQELLSISEKITLYDHFNPFY